MCPSCSLPQLAWMKQGHRHRDGGGTEEVARLSPLALGRQPEVKAKPISSIPSPPPGLPKKGLL